MNEDSNVFRILTNLENPFEESEIDHRNLPKCKNVSELNKIDLSSSNMSISAPKNVFDSFLKEKFDIEGIFGFMEIYTKLHIGEAFFLPVPENISVIFKVSNDPIDLSHFLTHYQSSIITTHNSSYLNLHNDTIYRFTLIRADFDWDKNANLFYLGYHYETEQFHFFIRSSIQFDLTVLYQKKAGT